MQMVSEAVTNATLRLVKGWEERFNQSENGATAEIGIIIGAICSICILFILTTCFSSKALGVCNCSPMTTAAGSGANDAMLTFGGANDYEDQQDERVEGHANVNASRSGRNTEGAYRSETESDDEGEGVNLSKKAQRRARIDDDV